VREVMRVGVTVQEGEAQLVASIVVTPLGSAKMHWGNTKRYNATRRSFCVFFILKAKDKDKMTAKMDAAEKGADAGEVNGRPTLTSQTSLKFP
jgi:hypothetical protein